jgi:general secretion pathway protein G
MTSALRLPRERQQGFSLLELIVVMAVLGILVAFALPAYQDATTRAREAVLKEDLQRMRESLEQYLTDKGAYPEALEDLVEFGYLRQIPVDPITRSAETWETEVAPWMMVDQGQPAGIWNVWSGAEDDSLDGTPYREW